MSEGSDTFESEELLAWEVGFRLQLLENLNFDLALFYNQYDGLVGAGNTTIKPSYPAITMTINPANIYDATTYPMFNSVKNIVFQFK